MDRDPPPLDTDVDQELLRLLNTKKRITSLALKEAVAGSGKPLPFSLLLCLFFFKA